MEENRTTFKTGEDLLREFRTLPAGQNLLYHLGFLACDRTESSVDSVALAAMQLEQEGRAELVQRRLARRLFEYLIVKRRVVDEEGVCQWDSFGSRVRKGERRPVPLKLMSSNHINLREAFFKRNPHLKDFVRNTAAADPDIDAHIASRVRPAYS